MSFLFFKGGKPKVAAVVDTVELKKSISEKYKLLMSFEDIAMREARIMFLRCLNQYKKQIISRKSFYLSYDDLENTCKRSKTFFTAREELFQLCSKRITFNDIIGTGKLIDFFCEDECVYLENIFRDRSANRLNNEYYDLMDSVDYGESSRESHLDIFVLNMREYLAQIKHEYNDCSTDMPERVKELNDALYDIKEKIYSLLNNPALSDFKDDVLSLRSLFHEAIRKDLCGLGAFNPYLSDMVEQCRDLDYLWKNILTTENLGSGKYKDILAQKLEYLMSMVRNCLDCPFNGGHDTNIKYQALNSMYSLKSKVDEMSDDSYNLYKKNINSIIEKLKRSNDVKSKRVFLPSCPKCFKF